MTLRQSVAWQLGVLGASVCASALMSAVLPDRVPIHWNLYGQVDAMGSKWALLLLGPVLVSLMLVLTLVLPRLSSPGGRPGFAFGAAMLMTSGLMGGIHAVLLWGAWKASVETPRLLMAVLFLFFALFGTVAGKLKPNRYVGIRTPWTLGDEEVWREAHGFAGRLMWWGGWAGLFLALVGAPLLVMVGVILVVALWPVVESYRIYRRRRGR